MPPKRSDLIHVTFHFHKSAVLLSVPGSTTLSALKNQLLPALKPLSEIIPSPPSTSSDYQLWEDKALIEGAEPAARELSCLEEGEGMKKSLQSLGWSRWKTVYVSFKDVDGKFKEPEYTIPDPDDGEGEGEEATAA